ncbi:MAG: hypothetical protein PSV17_09795 [Methylotenera sp.]|uniref:hypothetical protein n=1 Tax=Methylotenera sp. TaxID=2051956 RepID=UPI00248A6271|nr:hypothetical protein [Methylotenera sp.]MDI1309709.1 hypothetical protein [Methylotenera sp.]
MMTREDMMRELELLPVWRLRAPLPEAAAINEVTQVLTRQDIVLKANPQPQLVEIIEDTSLASPDESVEALTPVAIEPQKFTHIVSEDGEYLFLLPNAAMSTDELQLFQNICKALRIKTKPAETSSDILASISEMQTKLLLVMGEAVAQVILQSAESIAQLRGATHQLHGVALVATYGLEHLLQNPVDKAKIWRDLCMGLQIIQDLKITNTKTAKT